MLFRSIAKITIKGKNKGFTRDEFEYIIPVSDAEYMLEHLCIKPTISKYRYKIPYKGHFWEVDQFQKENEGLIMAEVEIENEDENLILPEWIGKEVSGDSRYYNSALIDNPYCNWKKDI